MVYIVMPIKDEAPYLNLTLDNFHGLNFNRIIAVINGCTDYSEDVVQNHPLYKEEKIEIIKFADSLGIDIPRALGAAHCYYKYQSQAIVFVDGDMIGNISDNLRSLIKALSEEEIDLALTNCYPYIYNRHPLVSTILSFREELNRELELFSQLGVALPSHGPHGLSRRILEIIPWEFLAIPPLSLAFAARNNFRIKVVTSIPHWELLSAARKNNHNIMVAETIIGDCIEALNYIHHLERQRNYANYNYLGYHPERRFDLLEEYLAKLKKDFRQV